MSCHDLVAYRHGFPYLGNKTFGIACEGGAPLANAPMVLIMGLSSTPVSLAPAGAPGCFLHTNLLILLSAGSTNKDSEGLALLPVPNAGSLLGLSINTQIGVLKNVNNFGYALSNEVTVKIIKL